MTFWIILFAVLFQTPKQTNTKNVTSIDFHKISSIHENCMVKMCSQQQKVLGTYHQGHLKFGGTSEIERTSNESLAIFFLAIKKSSKWQCCNLDSVLNHGDKLCKSQGVKHTLAIDEMPMSVTIENCEIRAKFLLLPTDFSNTADWFLHHKHLSSNEISCGGIWTCTGISFILI